MNTLSSDHGFRLFTFSPHQFLVEVFSAQFTHSCSCISVIHRVLYLILSPFDEIMIQVLISGFTFASITSYDNTAVQRQTAVIAYFLGEQLLFFAFAPLNTMYTQLLYVVIQSSKSPIQFDTVELCSWLLYHVYPPAWIMENKIFLAWIYPSV